MQNSYLFYNMAHANEVTKLNENSGLIKDRMGK